MICKVIYYSLFYRPGRYATAMATSLALLSLMIAPGAVKASATTSSPTEVAVFCLLSLPHPEVGYSERFDNVT